MGAFLDLLSVIVEVVYVILEFFKGLWVLLAEVAARSQRHTSKP